jgi:hypothetical protein
VRFRVNAMHKEYDFFCATVSHVSIRLNRHGGANSNPNCYPYTNPESKVAELDSDPANNGDIATNPANHGFAIFCYLSDS